MGTDKRWENYIHTWTGHYPTELLKPGNQEPIANLEALSQFTKASQAPRPVLHIGSPSIGLLLDLTLEALKANYELLF